MTKNIRIQIRQALADHRKLNVGLTPHMQTLARDNGAVLMGLENELKSESSCVAKVNALMADGLDMEQALAKVYDMTRYTLVFQSDVYVTGILSIQQAFKSDGFSLIKSTNYWGKADTFGYMGLNTVWQTVDGLTFEVQFHTAESFQTKMKIHYLYEIHRAGKQNTIKQMAGAWSQVLIPAGAVTL